MDAISLALALELFLALLELLQASNRDSFTMIRPG